MMKKLTVLLGAGFSANANMPIAKGVSDYFNRDLRDKLLNFSSSEWAWIDDKNKTIIHNGHLSFERLGYSYVFNELSNIYKSNNGEKFLNYEDFYQFISDSFKDNNKISTIFAIAKDQLLQDYPCLIEKEDSDHLFLFNYKQYFKVLPILNYLIADILQPIKMNNEELYLTFKYFLDYIKSYDEVNIFTLNHDLIVERILELGDIEYSRGFETNNSVLVANNNKLPVYTGNYNKKVRVYKLHGSIDLYKFNYVEKNREGYDQLTGEYDYFMTNDYYKKHRCQRVDSITGNIVQNVTPDIVPKFITGTDKTIIIDNDKMYKNIYSDFSRIMLETENLFVSGYSFNDTHINEHLIKNKKLSFINHRRTTDYPFSSNGKNISDFKDIL